MLHFTNADVGLAEQRLSRRRGARRALLRLAHRPARAQEAVLHHACGLSRRHRRDRVLVGSSRASALFRFFTGAGIGGEYTAINSTIQELVPARYRGWTDLVINGSFWVGAALGAVGSIVLLDPALLPPDIGWRCAFFIGAVLGLVIFRHAVVDSGIAALADDPWPRRRGRSDRRRHRGATSADAASVSGRGPSAAHPPARRAAITPLREVSHTLFRDHRRRTLVGLA